MSQILRRIWEHMLFHLHRRWSPVRQIAPHMPLCWIWLWWIIVLRNRERCSCLPATIGLWTLWTKAAAAFIEGVKDMLVCCVLNLPRSLSGSQQISCPPASVWSPHEIPNSTRYEIWKQVGQTGTEPGRHPLLALTRQPCGTRTLFSASADNNRSVHKNVDKLRQSAGFRFR